MTDFIEPRQLLDRLRRGKKVVIIDVRSAEEFAASHIEESINSPTNGLAAHTCEFSKDTTIVRVCNFGGTRSSKAAEQLRRLGYEKAIPLLGGIRNWFESEK